MINVLLLQPLLGSFIRRLESCVVIVTSQGQLGLELSTRLREVPGEGPYQCLLLVENAYSRFQNL